MVSTTLLIDVIGWVGVITLLVAYALVSARKFDGDSIIYQLMNLIGRALLIVNLFHYKAFPTVGVNIVWVGIRFSRWRESSWANRLGNG